MLIRVELIGHIGCKPKLQIKNQKISCAFLGGIALEQKYRGKGISKNLRTNPHNLSRTYEYAILWSDQLDLYKNLNLTPIIFTIRYLTNSIHNSPPKVIENFFSALKKTNGN